LDVCANCCARTHSDEEKCQQPKGGQILTVLQKDVEVEKLKCKVQGQTAQVDLRSVRADELNIPALGIKKRNTTQFRLVMELKGKTTGPNRRVREGQRPIQVQREKASMIKWERRGVVRLRQKPTHARSRVGGLSLEVWGRKKKPRKNAPLAPSSKRLMLRGKDIFRSRTVRDEIRENRRMADADPPSFEGDH